MKVNTALTFAMLISIFLIQCQKNPDGTVTTLPVSPQNLTAGLQPNNQINLNWKDISTNEQGFKIERKTSTSTFTVIASTDVNVTSYNDIGLAPNTTYTYRVFSFNSLGNSPTYTNEVSVSTTMSISTEITICNQIWAKKNLDVSFYKNGDPIPQVSDPTQWGNLTTGAWCYYNNDPILGSIYGKLYNFYAMNDPRGLAPNGWHIPSNGEWKKLVKCLDPSLDTTHPWQILSATAGGTMKETGTLRWQSPNTGATNASGFTALPGGTRERFGIFRDIGLRGNWWGTPGTTDTWYHTLYFDSNREQNGDFGNEKEGFSVRCVKN